MHICMKVRHFWFNEIMITNVKWASNGRVVLQRRFPIGSSTHEFDFGNRWWRRCTWKNRRKLKRLKHQEERRRKLMKPTRATTISSSTKEAKVISWIIFSQTSNYCLYPCLGCRRTLLDQISGPHSNPEVNGVAGTCCFCLRIRSQYLFEEGEFIQTLDLYTLDSEHQLLALDVMSMHISF